MFTYLSAGGSLLVVRVELVQSVKHLSDHVVQDASVAEVHQLHISVKAGLGLEGAPVVQLSECEQDGTTEEGNEGRVH